jgi:8-oxo-dGTP pyrophosphatase MutT (NUDIX family)
MEAEVRAAGGVVVCRHNGKERILIVHRPRYGDWSLPKGKLDPGEEVKEAALREVHEETGLSCEIVGLAGSTRYVDRSGRDKEVTYFIMEEKGGHVEHPRPTPLAAGEVDLVRWLDPDSSLRVLSYDRDRELVRSLFEQRPGPSERT